MMLILTIYLLACGVVDDEGEDDIFATNMSAAAGDYTIDL